jgi:radical SAM superfamily enzyme YgiQ (UPF0313 family)
MELPRREPGDELLRPGEMARLRMRLRVLAPKHDLATVIVCAFDHRTRMLPFFGADTKMAPGGPRAIGSAMVDVGFPKTRIVLGQWNPSFRPSHMRLDGRIPDLFMVSSTSLHFDRCRDLIRDACRIDPADRPLVIAGGPKVIYEPWDVFSADPDDPWAADVAVTGEEYVLLHLLEVLLSIRGTGESMRSTFLRARDSGALDDVPGLVYARTDKQGACEQLVDTGIQRLLGDLDELPHPVLGYQLLEPPSNRSTLGPLALADDKVRKHSRFGSLVLTLGCKFGCPYCPIPAYNQRQYRTKSGERISDEIEQIYYRYDIRFYFASDDNFFNDQQRTLEIAEALAQKIDAGSRPHCKIRWATEATVHDTLRMKDHLSTVRKAGLWALWLGVEDMSGTLVRKGQSADRTLEAFRTLRENGIFPMPMLMHHDAQPLVSWRPGVGLLNQVGRLRRAGAVYMQVLMLTPAPGSKSYEDNFTSRLAFQSVDGVAVGPHLTSGMHVIASRHPRPWIKQLNLLAAYVYFFNPLRLLWALVFPKTKIHLVDADTSPARAASASTGGTGVSQVDAWEHGPDTRATHAKNRPTLRRRLMRRLSRKARARLADALVQAFGMWGLSYTLRATLSWTWHLMRGRIQRHTKAPVSRIPMRGVDGGRASHALPGTPTLISAPLPIDRKKAA